MVFLDRSKQVSQTPVVFWDVLQRKSFLRILDTRVNEVTIDSPFIADIADLQERLSENPNIHSIAILFHDRMLDIEAGGVRFVE